MLKAPRLNDPGSFSNLWRQEALLPGAGAECLPQVQNLREVIIRRSGAPLESSGGDCGPSLALRSYITYSLAKTLICVQILSYKRHTSDIIVMVLLIHQRLC